MGGYKIPEWFPGDQKAFALLHNCAWRFKITVEEAYELRNRTNCEICDRILGSGRDRAIDHCHDTGKIRGVLCNECNRGLGLLKDNKEILSNAIKYLDEKGRA